MRIDALNKKMILLMANIQIVSGACLGNAAPNSFFRHVCFTVVALILMLISGCALKDAPPINDQESMGYIDNKQASQDIPAGIYRAKDMVLDYFSPLNGIVEDIADGLVRIRIADDGQIKKGMRFSVFREGAPFYHPVTNELIGKAEDLVGRIEVKEVNEADGLHLCSILSGDVQAGDKARISSSRIKLVFFQDRKADWFISEAFHGSLSDSGRFEINDSYAKNYEPDTLSKLARDLGSEAVLIFSTPVREGGRFVNVKLYWAEDAEKIAEIEEIADQGAAGMFTREEEFITKTFQDLKPWRSYVLPGGRLIAMGDVDGNGMDEFVVSDGRDIRIYSLKDELQELWFIEGGGDGKHISLDILDVNKNGRAEIFVTSVVNGNNINSGDSVIYTDDSSIDSFVIEYDPSVGYKRIQGKMPYFLRVSGRMLLMQKFSRNRVFGGPVSEGEWKDGLYQTGRPLRLPDDANIYGFTYVDWQNNGRADLITFDNNGYLSLYDDSGNLKWKSAGSYGPFPFSFNMKAYSVTSSEVKWDVRGRLISINTGSGQEVVAIKRKPVLSGVPGLGVNAVDVYSLWWDGSVMNEKMVLGEISGSVTDYWIQDTKLYLIAGGGVSAFLGNITEGKLSNISILYYYNLAPLEAEP